MKNKTKQNDNFYNAVPMYGDYYLRLRDMTKPENRLEKLYNSPMDKKHGFFAMVRHAGSSILVVCNTLLEFRDSYFEFQDAVNKETLNRVSNLSRPMR